jgi:D-arabinose 1-dehydrogenase-like Zn-dependent alcohol dehydrogenase
VKFGGESGELNKGIVSQRSTAHPKVVVTFNGIDADGTVTMGGYSTHIVVRERYVILLKL